MNVAINKVAVTVRISTATAQSVTLAAVKQVLGISPSGSATKYLNEQGGWTTPAGGGGGSVAWGSITGSLIAQTDLQNALNGKQASGDYATNTALTNGLATKQDSLGFTPENVSNKSTSVSTDKASDTKYPSVKSVYDYYAYVRMFYQTTAETSLTGTTSETLIDSVLIPANTLAANDIVQLTARTLKTTTAAGTLRIYINSSGSLSGATLLGSFQMAAASRFAGFERQIAVKASGLLEVLAAANTTNTLDETTVNAVETTTTVTLSSDLYLITSMQLGNSGDTMRRSFTQVQIQRAL
jgi:hypothetical protein